MMTMNFGTDGEFRFSVMLQLLLGRLSAARASIHHRPAHCSELQVRRLVLNIELEDPLPDHLVQFSTLLDFTQFAAKDRIEVGQKTGFPFRP